MNSSMRVNQLPVSAARWQHWFQICFATFNGKEATVNRAPDGNMYPGEKLVHSVFGEINYGGLKHNSIYLGLVVPSSG
jgi:hypothetical protein